MQRIVFFNYSVDLIDVKFEVKAFFTLPELVALRGGFTHRTHVGLSHRFSVRVGLLERRVLKHLEQIRTNRHGHRINSGLLLLSYDCFLLDLLSLFKV